ncbi:hypothetical protein KM043_016815 [Ampulex compressa]|nr:hypothetical protein KM043_016815 [Ampulex compressa]
MHFLVHRLWGLLQTKGFEMHVWREERSFITYSMIVSNRSADTVIRRTVDHEGGAWSASKLLRTIDEGGIEADPEYHPGHTARTIFDGFYAIYAVVSFPSALLTLSTIRENAHVEAVGGYTGGCIGKLSCQPQLD